MDNFAFIHTPDPTKVRVVEQERNKDETRLLDTIVGRIVPLLPITPDRADSELEASVERLFDEGGSGTQTEQGHSARGGLDANIQPVVEAAKTVVEDAASMQVRHQGKRKFVVVDAGGISHPPKKSREDHGTPSGASVGASVSTTPEHEDGDHTDSVAEPNLSTIGGPSSVTIMTTITTTTSTVDPTLATKKKFVEPFLFGAGSSFADGTDPITCVFLDLTSSDFLTGVIRTVINPDIDLQKVYVPQWSVTNGSRLDDGRVCCEMVDEFAPSKFFASVRGMKHDQLFTEFNVGVARQMSLSAEVRMRVEYNVKEKRRLKSVVENQGELLKAREEEIESLKARLLLKEAEAAEAIRLRAEASNFETVEKSLWDETNALREQMDNFAFIHTPNPTKVRVVEQERNKDEPRLLDTIVGRTVPLLPITPDRADSELEASVERLFDEGGSGTQTEQGHSARGGLDANIQPVVEAANTIVEDAASVQVRHQGKRKFVVVDAGGVSHPPKKSREDHGTPSGASIGASVSTTPEHEDVDHTDSVAEPNLSTIGDPITGVFLDLNSSDFLTGVIRTVINPDIDLQKVYVPQWSVTNGSRLDDGRVCCEMVDEFAPSKFFASVRGMKHDQLFTEFNVGI
nr:hypothetical protein [Tanacetum cinerariifolium]